LAQQVREATGIDVYFASASGSSFDTRWNNIVYKASALQDPDWQRWADAVLLVGGWNHNSIWDLETRLGDLNKFCQRLLPRKLQK
jgi:hypothetical protein